MVRERQSPRTGVKPDEPGGEVVQVSISVNNRLVFIRHATLFENGRFALDDGTRIAHGRARGPLDLVKKILNRL